MLPKNEGYLHWHIADWCNYACSYCCENRFDKDKKPRFVKEPLLGAALRFLKALPGHWTVRLTSGEPSTHPELLYITRRLAEMGHDISIITNLSLPLERYQRFVLEAGHRLDYLHISFHLEEADEREFIAKCAALKGFLAKRAAADLMGVYCVALPEYSEKIRSAMERFKGKGIDLKLQLYMPNARALGMRSPRRSAVFLGASRSAPEQPSRLQKAAWSLLKESRWAAVRHEGRKMIESFPGSFEPSAVPKLESPKGKPCLAGIKWIVVDVGGDVWRCHNAYQGDHLPGVYLGNVLKGDVALLPTVLPCSYDYCGCPGHPID
ncbi:MAG TPA: radical SAM protein [Elusimicrobiota bacterium]|nr:radical SAM protein [Elusimicrobiota bacterium]